MLMDGVDRRKKKGWERIDNSCENCVVLGCGQVQNGNVGVWF